MFIRFQIGNLRSNESDTSFETSLQLSIVLRFLVRQSQHPLPLRGPLLNGLFYLSPGPLLNQRTQNYAWGTFGIAKGCPAIQYWDAKCASRSFDRQAAATKATQ